MSQGKLGDPGLAEACLQQEMADFIGLGHQSLADPQWVNKVKRNETYDIVPCIGCNECLYAGFSGKIIQCAVNPLCFSEDYYPVTQAKEGKKVLVIGAGPGEMEAAVTAAARGIEVELWEKSNKLGGTLLAAGGPTFKKDVSNYVQYMVGKVYRSNIRLKLMKKPQPTKSLQATLIKSSLQQVLVRSYHLLTGYKKMIKWFSQMIF